MEIFGLVLSILVFILGLAVFGNQLRLTHKMSFELKPNCLLTRHPLLFIHGRKSIFYFKNYWNLYPIFLAEHGYEIYHLNLPWRKTNLRQEYFKTFASQLAENKKFHLVMDLASFEELQSLIPETHHFHSVTLLCNTQESHKPTKAYSLPCEDIVCSQANGKNLLNQLAFSGHTHLLKNPFSEQASLSTLGAAPQTALTNSLLLLERAQYLAEMDLRND